MKVALHRGARMLALAAVTVSAVGLFTVTRNSVAHTTGHAKDSSSLLRPTSRNIYHRIGKVVILYSNQRSGSTFVGDFFNRNPEAFYLFEPLFSYTPSCSFLYQERLNTLYNISTCDFRSLPDDYHRAHSVNHYNDRAGKCLKENICFIHNHPNLDKKYGSLCSAMRHGNLADDALQDVGKTIEKYEKDNAGHRPTRHEACGKPFNMTLVSAMCSSSYLVAYKVLRVCNLSKLEQVYRRLTDEGNEVYVVHLVRDPRAIVNSCLRTELGFASVKDKAIALCTRMNENIDYVLHHEIGKDSESKILADGRYLRIRHEDISLDPVKAAEEIYRFAGLPLPQKVRQWVEESSVDPVTKIRKLREKASSPGLSLQERQEISDRVSELSSQRLNPYGTVRNSKDVIDKWRTALKMDTITIIQEHCGDAMQKLGYQLVENEEQLKNKDIKLW